MIQNYHQEYQWQIQRYSFKIQKDSINKLSEDLNLPIHRLEDFCTKNYELSEKTYNDIIGTKNCEFSYLYDTYFNPRHKQGYKNT